MFLRGLLIVTAMILGAGVGSAQGPAPDGPPLVPPPPQPVGPPSQPSPLPPGLPALPQPVGPAPVLVPPPQVVYVQDAQPWPWRFAQPPGWFVALEAAPTLPHVHVRHSHERGTDLNWTVAPRFTLGYCLTNGGSLLLSYRNLTSQVSTSDPVEELSQRLRLNANWLDLTYLSRPYNPWRNLRVQWESGVRSAYLYSDVRNEWPGAAATVRDTFWGAGPHAGIRLAWWFGDTGLSLFTRLDVAVLFGQTRERASLFYPDATGAVTPWMGSRTCGCPVWDSRFELGLGYVVPSRPWLRFDTGFQTEAFTWSDMNYSDRGPFVRCVLGF